MTLLFISLLPYNSVGLDFGLSCFFMWLLCFLIAWRSWPECQCPRIRYCTLPGEVESEMPLFPFPDTLPFWNIQPHPPPACIPASPLGEGGSSLLELPASTWTPKPLALEDISSPRFGTLSRPVLRERGRSVPEPPAGLCDGGVTFCPAGRADFPTPTEGWPWPGDEVSKVVFLPVLHTPFHSFHLRGDREWLGRHCRGQRPLIHIVGHRLKPPVSPDAR